MRRLRLEEIDVHGSWVQQKEYFRVSPKIYCVVEMKISHTVKSKSKLSLCQTHRPPKCKLHAKIVKWLIHGTKDSKALVDNHSSHSDLRITRSGPTRTHIQEEIWIRPNCIFMTRNKRNLWELESWFLNKPRFFPIDLWLKNNNLVEFYYE